jgi:hypothetical protein
VGTPAATVPAATHAFPSFIYNTGEERSPNLLKLKKIKSCYESYPEQWGQLCVKVDQESNLHCLYFGFSIFSCNNNSSHLMVLFSPCICTSSPLQLRHLSYRGKNFSISCLYQTVFRYQSSCFTSRSPFNL